MSHSEEQATPSRPASRRSVPLLRLSAAMLALAAVTAVALVWGAPLDSLGGAAHQGVASRAPNFRYVNSGWIAPHHAREAGAFSEDLQAFVILNQEELEAFEDGYDGKVTRGNATTLGRIDFDRAVLLAAYYVWRPVRGDPLTVTGVLLIPAKAGTKDGGDSAVVDLELSYDPQGREYPYLYAPMIMVAVERSLFSQGEMVEFQFRLNGQPVATLTATPNPDRPRP